MPGTLFLIPSSLGETPWNTYLPGEAHRIVCGLTRFIAENARTTRAELKRLNHPTTIQQIGIEQLAKNLAPRETDRLLAPLLANEDVGLMSEAGCPGVADPGALLVRRAHELGIPVRPLVGPSSLLLALMASGLDGQRFAFHGYLPAREPERSRRVMELEKESRKLKQTQMFIETPYRNEALFQALLTACRPETRLCTATDLTLPTENVITRRIADWRDTAPPSLDRRPTVFLLLSAD